MSYLVVCTFDLKNASNQDYQAAYADLKLLGLNKVVVSSQGNTVVIPTTAVAGQYAGSSASAICADLRQKIKSSFTAHGFSSEIFVTVGGDWSWTAVTT